MTILVIGADHEETRFQKGGRRGKILARSRTAASHHHEAPDSGEKAKSAFQEGSMRFLAMPWVVVAWLLTTLMISPLAAQ